MNEERRKAVRRRTLFRGSLGYGDGRITHPCVVKDVSTGGARVLLETEVSVPDKLELSVPQLELNRRACLLRWSRGREIGISFGAADLPSAAAHDPAFTDANGRSHDDRIAVLETEIQKIHRQLAELRLDIKRYRNEE